MVRKKLISFMLIIAMVLTVWTPAFEEVAVAVPALGGSHTVLDISKGSIIIGANGASGGGLQDSETVLNPDGYKITGTSNGNTITVESNVDTVIYLESLTMTTSNNVCFSAGQNANITLVLSDVNMTANNTSTSAASAKSAITLGSGSVTNLYIRNNNTLHADNGAGIGLADNAQLTIDGDSLAALNATGVCGFPGIGNSAQQVRNTVITINGGIITAIGGKVGAGCPGIGGYSSSSTGTIIINGGTIKASSAKTGVVGIGYGANPNFNHDPAIVINGGSIIGSVQGKPVNSNGNAVYLVEATAAGMANQEFTYVDFNNITRKLVADDNGKLYLYVYGDEDISVSHNGAKYYGKIIKGADGNSATAELIKYDGPPCSCNSGNSTLNFPDKDVTVYNVWGSEQVPLDVDFQSSEGCKYPSHTIESISYKLLGNVAQDVAIIKDNVLTVYSAAANKTLQVSITATVNNIEYNKTANIRVSSSDDYVFDLSKSSIVVHNDVVEYDGREYSLTDTTKPVKIIQNGKEPTANTISVADNVSKTLIIENLNITREKVLGSPLFNLGGGSIVDLRLEGKNTIVENAGNEFPAIHLTRGSELQISGEGSLDVTGAAKTPGIGGMNEDTPGDLVINGGRIIARGGETAAGLGAGASNKSITTNTNVTVNGGRVITVGGPNSSSDFKAVVTINGGSVATLDANDAVSAAVRFDSGAAMPQNNAGQDLYPVTLTFEDDQADMAVEYTVNTGDISGAKQTTYTDDNSKLYFYLPAATNYQQVVATPSGSNEPYYKRLKVSDKNTNTGILSKNPVAKFISFTISGQIGNTDIDNDAKTIKVTMPDGTSIDNLQPNIDAGGAEYTPQGAVDFSANNPTTYTLIADDGTKVNYTVNIEQRQLAPGEKTELNIANGDIWMADSGNITVGGIPVIPNSNGYIITGSSSEHCLIIEDMTDIPIVFRDLTISAPPLFSDSLQAVFTVYDHADITLEGVNTITGASDNNAAYTSGIFTVDGEGILKLNGGAGMPAVGGEEGGYFVINGGSVFINDKSPLNSWEPVSSVNNGKTLYPLTITIDDKNVAGNLVSYSDTPSESGVEAIKDKRYLADENGTISVYRPKPNTGADVKFDYDFSVSYGDNGEYKCYGKTAIPAEVTVGLPQIKELSFTPPTTSFGVTLPITLSGKYLGGDMVITAIGQDGTEFSATAVYENEDGNWVATLVLPSNEEDGDYTYTLTATADGRSQTLSGNTTITMLKSLKINSFKLDKYQMGDEVITENLNDKIGYVDITVPYDVDLTNVDFSPTLGPSGISYSPHGRRNFSIPVQYIIYNSVNESIIYTVTVTPETAPTVESISFINPGYSGGNVDITLNGKNLDNILNAVTEDGGRITVSVGGKDYYLTKEDIEKGIDKVTVTVPGNAAGIQDMLYPVTVSINGVQQTLTGEDTINVPSGVEMNATISGFSFEDLPECAPELNLNQAVIDDKEEDETGTINISVPWKTDLTSLIPTVVTTNPGARYVPRGAVDFSNPVTYTVTAVKGNTKDYIVTVTRVASAAEKDPSIKSITVEEQRESVIEQTPNEEGLIPITITMPSGTDLSNVEPVIELAHPDAYYEPHGPQDFSEAPQVYTVTAADGTIQKYEITVKNASKKNKKPNQVLPIIDEQEVDFKAYINGYDDKTFRPNNSITRAEASAMLARLDDDFKENTKYSHEFEDVSNDYWATDYIGYLYKNGVVKGTNGLFDASREITRMEFVAMLTRYMEMDEVSTQDIKFNDIDNVWGRDEILLAAGNGITSGYADGTFRPNKSITRAEAVAMLNRLLDRSPAYEVKAAMDKQESPFRDLTKAHWAYAEIMSAVKNYGVKTISTTNATGETAVEVTVNFK